jgi:type I restriction enzyme S subunit
LADAWDRLSLREIATLNTESNVINADADDVYVGMEHLDPGKRRITRFGDPTDFKSQKARFQEGDVLYGKLRPYLRKVALAGQRGVCTTEILVFRPVDGIVTSAFLYYVLASPEVFDFSVARQTGTKMPRIAPKLLVDLELPVPPLAAQERIVDLLSALDDAIEAADDKAAIADRLLLTEIERELRSDPLAEGSQLVQLDAISDIRSGITKGRKTKNPTSEYPFLRVANVQYGWLDLADIHQIAVTAVEAEKFKLADGDVLLTEGGNKEDVGRGWVWAGQVEDCLHQNHVHRARPDRDLVEPQYLAYAICTHAARAYCFARAKQTNNLASLNKTEVSGLPVPLPSLGEQRRIVDHLDAIRDVRDAAMLVSERLLALRPAATFALLSGDHAIPETYDRVTTMVSDPELTVA